jgi:hypothetical protein
MRRSAAAMTAACRRARAWLTGEPAALVPGRRLFTFAGGTELGLS